MMQQITIDYTVVSIGIEIVALPVQHGPGLISCLSFANIYDNFFSNMHM